MKRMTFKQFQATKRECADLGEPTTDESLAGRAGLVYMDVLYIETGDYGYCLTIGNSSECGTDLARFERQLYDFAKSEGYCDLAA